MMTRMDTMADHPSSACAAPPVAEDLAPVELAARDLRVEFGPPDRPVRAVDGVSLDLRRGQTLALVGESGSGKSVFAQALTRLLPTPPARYAGGSVIMDGTDLLQLRADRLRAWRGRGVAYVFQEPGAALNPVVRVGEQVGEALRLHQPGVARRAEAERLLGLVGIPDPAARRRLFPHQLSGGMQQRVVIAMALACRPRVLVADEPTTALDVTIQAQILALLADLQRRYGMAILLITHNLGLVAGVAHALSVMYAGRLVESGAPRDVLRAPRHPYTAALLAAVPALGGPGGRLQGIPGSVPPAARWPAGCRFHPRCPHARAECRSADPAWHSVGPGWGVACHFPLAGAPAGDYKNREPSTSKD